MQKRSVCFLILFFFIFVSQGRADIIKLKRGISFEGKVLEEAGDVYVVELSVGVVNFKKNEVDSIEYLSDMSNDKMFEEWTSPDITEPVKDADIVTKEMVEDSAESDAFVEGYAGAQSSSGDSGKSQDMVRYKGRYITPEVYDIIQKEKDIQQRRYSFIQKQKQQKEKQDSASLSPKVVAPYGSSKKSPEKQFGGAYDSVKNNARFKRKAGMYDDSKYRSYEEATKAYGAGSDHNSI